MSTPFYHDGNMFDLDRTYLDVIGGRWKWNGQWNEAGEPLMQSREVVLSLPDVYHDHGPLIVVRVPTTGAAMRDALSDGFAASTAAGYVEADPDVWAARLNGGVA